MGAKERGIVKLIFNARTIFEVLLVILIPFFNMGSNTLVEKIAQITSNYTIPNFLIIASQMIFSIIVLFVVYEIEKNQNVKGIKQMLIISLALTILAYSIRLISFLSRGLIGIVFSSINNYSSFGIETVFVVSIPVVKILDSFEPFLGVLLIVFLRSFLNMILILPLMGFSLIKLGIWGVFITLYVSQFVIMFLFAKLPFELSRMPFLSAVKESIFHKDRHFTYILTFSSIYALIVAVSVLSLPIFKSQYIFPAIINFLSVYMLLAFFVFVSREETYGQ